MTFRLSCEPRENCRQSKSALAGKEAVAFCGNCGLFQVIVLISSGVTDDDLSKSTVMVLKNCENRCLGRLDSFLSSGFSPSCSILSPFSSLTSSSSESSEGVDSSLSPSSNRPSIFTLYRPEPGVFPGSPAASCHGWFSTVLDIQMRIVRYFFTVLLIESWMSSLLRTMEASRRFSRSRRFLYCGTPSPITTSSTPSGMFLSVGLRLRRRTASLGCGMLR